MTRVGASVSAVPEKHPYEPPRLVIIDLAADEVLATGCKTPSQRAVNSLIPPCWAVPCNQKGS